MLKVVMLSPDLGSVGKPGITCNNVETSMSLVLEAKTRGFGIENPAVKARSGLLLR